MTDYRDVGFRKHSITDLFPYRNEREERKGTAIDLCFFEDKLAGDRSDVSYVRSWSTPKLRLATIGNGSREIKISKEWQANPKVKYNT